MTETMQPIDVEKIMEEIRAEIKAKGYDNTMLSFRDVDGTEKLNRMQMEVKFNLKELEYHVQQVNLRSHVEWYHQVEGGKLANLFKKVIRKLTRFMIIPVVEEQNAQNEAVFDALNQLLAYVKEQEDVITDLQRQLEEEKKETK